MNEVEATDQNFEQEVLQADVPVLVDFWAEWCGPCKIIAPIIKEIANEYQGKLKVAKVDCDRNNALTTQYNILSIPTMKFFVKGQPVAEIVGAAPKATIEAELKKILQ